MKTHVITGGGGVQLHVVETGNPQGRAIVFIHGFSQCWRAWKRQLSSPLAEKFRLVAVDLRGHGLSDRPRDGYADSKLWADDVHATIAALRLDRPILCGWSYGPLVILDYIRHYGEEAIGGINIVAGVTKLGSDAAISVLSADFLGLIPGFFSADPDEGARALDALIGLCFMPALPPEERYLMLGFSLSVPPYVRQGLFSRAFDNDDLLPKLRKPVLITQADDDAVVKPVVVEQQMGVIAHAQIHRMTKAGHACFWNDAAAYNRVLAEFAAES
jgi:pimeloyl-ACP methyl ester carboxylesterase